MGGGHNWGLELDWVARVRVCKGVSMCVCVCGRMIMLLDQLGNKLAHTGLFYWEFFGSCFPVINKRLIHRILPFGMMFILYLKLETCKKPKVNPGRPCVASACHNTAGNTVMSWVWYSNHIMIVFNKNLIFHTCVCITLYVLTHTDNRTHTRFLVGDCHKDLDVE